MALDTLETPEKVLEEETTESKKKTDGNNSFKVTAEKYQNLAEQLRAMLPSDVDPEDESEFLQDEKALTDITDRTAKMIQISGREKRSYLDRFLEGTDAKPSGTNILIHPLDIVDYEKYTNRVHIEHSGIAINFEYGPADRGGVKNPIEGMVYEPMRVLKNYTFQVGDLPPLDVSEELPEGAQIIFTPVNGYTGEHYARADSENNVIYVEGDMASVDTFLGILHEIGHLRANDADDDALKDYADGLLTKQIASAVLRDERKAWAYALKKIKPYIGHSPLLTKENIGDSIHARSLAAYHQLMRERLGKNERIAVGK